MKFFILFSLLVESVSTLLRACKKLALKLLKMKHFNVRTVSLLLHIFIENIFRYITVVQ